MTRNALIVCSDTRANELANVLSPQFHVYRRCRFDGLWADSEWTNQGWVACSTSVPKSVDIMFFHTGQNDPSGIPTDLHATVEFAFSSGGLAAKESPAGRQNTIPIQRRFSTDRCPIKPRHLRELDELLEQRRKEPLLSVVTMKR